jgi:hypothetical protein
MICPLLGQAHTSRLECPVHVWQIESELDSPNHVVAVAGGRRRRRRPRRARARPCCLWSSSRARLPGGSACVLAPPWDLLQSAAGPVVGELPRGLLEDGKRVQLQHSVRPWRRPGGARAEQQWPRRPAATRLRKSSTTTRVYVTEVWGILVFRHGPDLLRGES